jgi:hypothetical protein
MEVFLFENKAFFNNFLPIDRSLIDNDFRNFDVNNLEVTTISSYLPLYPPLLIVSKKTYQFQKIWSKAVYKESGRRYIVIEYFLGGKIYATIFESAIHTTRKCGKPKSSGQVCHVTHLHR